MLHLPKNNISEKALTVWRIYGLLSTIVCLALVGVAVYFVFFQEMISIWFFYGALAFLLLEAIVSIIVLPALRYRSFRYEIRGEDLLLQKGLFIRTQTLIPLSRVQHVDTTQGPVLRKFQLASVEISTAATRHEIPALSEVEAEDLRGWISEWIKVEGKHE